MIKPRVPCEACDGSGQRALTEQERNTHAAVGPDWSTTSAINARLTAIQQYQTKDTALANRLVALRSLGLVERRNVNGKRCEWRQKAGR